MISMTVILTMLTTTIQMCVQEQRCAGKERARWRACCAGRWAAVMHDSAAMSTDVYDSMSSEESEEPGLI